MTSAAAIIENYKEVRSRLNSGVPKQPIVSKAVIPPAPDPEPQYRARDILWLSKPGRRSPRLDGLTCPPEPRLIILQVLDKHNLCWAAMTGLARFKKIVDCRHEIFVRLHEELGWPFARIGRLMGKDHTTVMNAIRKHNKRLLEPVAPSK